MKLGKITRTLAGGRQGAGRSYHDACGAAHGLDLIGERWALLVMRELMLGPKRFSVLKAGLPGISANVLTQRLEGLEAAGVLSRRKLPPPASTQVYELTPWGYEAEPILQLLGRWATRSATHDPSLPLSSASLMVSFRAMLDPRRAAGIDATIGIEIGDEIFALRVANSALGIERGDPVSPDLIFAGPATAIAAVVYGDRSFAEAESSGDLRIEGDRGLAEKFVMLFPLPPKAER